MSLINVTTQGDGSYVLQIVDPNPAVVVSGNPIMAVDVIVKPKAYVGSETEAQRDQFMQDLVDLLSSNSWGISCVKQYNGTGNIYPTE